MRQSSAFSGNPNLQNLLDLTAARLPSGAALPPRTRPFQAAACEAWRAPAARWGLWAGRGGGQRGVQARRGMGGSPGGGLHPAEGPAPPCPPGPGERVEEEVGKLGGGRGGGRVRGRWGQRTLEHEALRVHLRQPVPAPRGGPLHPGHRVDRRHPRPSRAGPPPMRIERKNCSSDLLLGVGAVSAKNKTGRARGLRSGERPGFRARTPPEAPLTPCIPPPLRHTICTRGAVPLFCLGKGQKNRLEKSSRNLPTSKVSSETSASDPEEPRKDVLPLANDVRRFRRAQWCTTAWAPRRSRSRCPC